MGILLIIGAAAMLLTADGGRLVRNISARLSPTLGCITYTLPAAQRWDGVFLVASSVEDTARPDACRLAKLSLSVEHPGQAGWRRSMVIK